MDEQDTYMYGDLGDYATGSIIEVDRYGFPDNGAKVAAALKKMTVSKEEKERRQLIFLALAPSFYGDNTTGFVETCRNIEAYLKNG